jgi:hypothetical protein
MSIDVRRFVQDLELSLGQLYRGNCPVCKRYKTFTAINDNGKLMWNCYANSCNVAGITRTQLTASELYKMMREEKYHQDLPIHFDLPDWVIVDYGKPYLSTLCDRYQLDPHWLDLRYDIREDRVVFPIRHEGKLVDATGRAGHPEVQPKWRRYGEARVPYIVGDTSVAVVVEDCISAAVVDTVGGTGFALLGTALLDEHKDMLYKYAAVVVALDPDAMSKTLLFTRELRAGGINAKALNLQDDIKYRTQEDIDKLKQIIGE